jgi:hypothetical protein
MEPRVCADSSLDAKGLRSACCYNSRVISMEAQSEAAEQMAK